MYIGYAELRIFPTYLENQRKFLLDTFINFVVSNLSAKQKEYGNLNVIPVHRKGFWAPSNEGTMVRN